MTAELLRPPGAWLPITVRTLAEYPKLMTSGKALFRFGLVTSPKAHDVDAPGDASAACASKKAWKMPPTRVELIPVVADMLSIETIAMPAGRVSTSVNAGVVPSGTVIATRYETTSPIATD